MSAETHSKKRFASIGPVAVQHPADRAALAALRKVPGFDMVLRRFIGLVGERSLRSVHMASTIRVGPKQFPHLDEMLQECVEILDMDRKPEMFVAQAPFVNAGAIGTQEPFLVLHSAALSLFSKDELQFVIGHELGHILADHVLYKTMLKLMLKMAVVRYGFPLSWVVLTAVIAALNEWDRKSELTADRVGLLCVQNPDIAYSALMKTAGGGDVEGTSLEGFAEQARAYRGDGEKLDSFYKILNLIGQSHPFPVQRFHELQRWAEEGQYTEVLGGQYETRDASRQRSLYDEIAASARAYRAAYDESDDPLVQFFKDVGKGVSDRGGQIFSNIKDVFSKMGG